MHIKNIPPDHKSTFPVYVLKKGFRNNFSRLFNLAKKKKKQEKDKKTNFRKHSNSVVKLSNNKVEAIKQLIIQGAILIIFYIIF